MESIRAEYNKLDAEGKAELQKVYEEAINEINQKLDNLYRLQGWLHHLVLYIFQR